jgi:hypothetical protein
VVSALPDTMPVLFAAISSQTGYMLLGRPQPVAPGRQTLPYALASGQSLSVRVGARSAMQRLPRGLERTTWNTSTLASTGCVTVRACLR